MTQKRLPPKDKREYFDTKIREVEGGHWHWHIPSRPMTSFSWTEVINGVRENFALNIRKTSWHYSGRKLLPGKCIVVTCGDSQCINPKHLDQVTFSEARMRISPEIRSNAGRSMLKRFTDQELEDIWIDADNIQGRGLAQRYNVCVNIIWNIQKGLRNRDDIIRLFGPQELWGRDRIRKYPHAKKNSRRNSTTAKRARSTA